MSTPCHQCKKAAAVLQCSACKTGLYCSVPCQKAAWKGTHKTECRALKLVCAVCHRETPSRFCDDKCAAGHEKFVRNATDELVYCKHVDALVSAEIAAVNYADMLRIEGSGTDNGKKRPVPEGELGAKRTAVMSSSSSSARAASFVPLQDTFMHIMGKDVLARIVFMSAFTAGSAEQKGDTYGERIAPDTAGRAYYAMCSVLITIEAQQFDAVMDALRAEKIDATLLLYATCVLKDAALVLFTRLVKSPSFLRMYAAQRNIDVALVVAPPRHFWKELVRTAIEASCENATIANPALVHALLADQTFLPQHLPRFDMTEDMDYPPNKTTEITSRCLLSWNATAAGSRVFFFSYIVDNKFHNPLRDDFLAHGSETAWHTNVMLWVNRLRVVDQAPSATTAMLNPANSFFLDNVTDVYWTVLFNVIKKVGITSYETFVRQKSSAAEYSKLVLFQTVRHKSAVSPLQRGIDVFRAVYLHMYGKNFTGV